MKRCAILGGLAQRSTMHGDASGVRRDGEAIISYSSFRTPLIQGKERKCRFALRDLHKRLKDCDVMQEGWAEPATVDNTLYCTPSGRYNGCDRVCGHDRV